MTFEEANDAIETYCSARNEGYGYITSEMKRKYENAIKAFGLVEKPLCYSCKRYVECNAECYLSGVFGSCNFYEKEEK